MISFFLKRLSIQNPTSKQDISYESVFESHPVYDRFPRGRCVSIERDNKNRSRDSFNGVFVAVLTKVNSKGGESEQIRRVFVDNFVSQIVRGAHLLFGDLEGFQVVANHA